MKCGKKIGSWSRVRDESLPPQIVCEVCGRKNARTRRFCGHCDSSLYGMKRKLISQLPEHVQYVTVRLREPIPMDFSGAIRLRQSEEATRFWGGRLSNGSLAGKDAKASSQQPVWPGILISTNHRFVFLEERGRQANTCIERESILYEDVTDISVFTGTFAQDIRIEASSHGRAWRISKLEQSDGKYWTGANLEEARAFGEFVVRRRLQEVEEEKRRERVQFVIDFSFLKKEMLKGGIVVQTVKCPSCGASIDLPTTGTSTKCQYCGSAVQAHDIFEKMKGLIAGL